MPSDGYPPTITHPDFFYGFVGVALVWQLVFLLNALVAKLSTFGTFPTSYLLGGGYFVVHPDNGATWKIRAAITILLPRKK